MGITVSFIFCLLSGIVCFWLFGNVSIGLKQFKERGELSLCTQHYL